MLILKFKYNLVCWPYQPYLFFLWNQLCINYLQTNEEKAFTVDVLVDQ